MSSPQALSQKQLADAILDMVRHPGCKGKFWTPEDMADQINGDGPPDARDFKPVTARDVWTAAYALKGRMLVLHLYSKTFQYKGTHHDG